MDRDAVQLSREVIESQNLKESADIHEEDYQRDAELQKLTDAAIEGWPE